MKHPLSVWCWGSWHHGERQFETGVCRIWFHTEERVGAREEGAPCTAHVCLIGAQIQVHKFGVWRRGRGVQSLTAATSADCLERHFSSFVGRSFTVICCLFQPSTQHNYRVHWVQYLISMLLTTSVIKLTISDWLQFGFTSENVSVVVLYPRTHQERWSGCHGSRYFCMHVCLHVCGKFVGGWLKGDYAHLFVTVYIYLSGINKTMPLPIHKESEVAPGWCDQQDVSCDRTEQL